VLGFEMCMHALPATAATNAFDLSADVAKLQEQLGHANIATTCTYGRRKTRPKHSSTFKVVNWKGERSSVADLCGAPLKKLSEPLDDPRICLRARRIYRCTMK